ncbi:MAG TPA: DUF1761 domain-containing protein [Saprospiraceae bacterium]|nr:DUF1761 domain-containing protein [Saprospiraceae bacterium]
MENSITINWLALGVAALIPFVTGFIYYGPKTMGKIWQREEGLSDEQIKSANMGMIMGVSLIFNFLIAFMLQTIVIHQFGMFSALIDPTIGDLSQESGATFKMLMEKYGNNFRTFKHGVFHGVLTALFLVFPIIGVNGLFARKSFKLILIQSLYWLITLGLMGGVICMWK